MRRIIAVGATLAGLVMIDTASQQHRGYASDIHQLYVEDQKDRGVGGESLPYDQLEIRDRKRRAQLRELLQAGVLKTGEDFHDAAYIYQHGEVPDDYLLAHVLGTLAVAKGDNKSLWISAAALDRYLHAIHQAQVFGTQYQSTGDSPVTQEPYARSLVPDALRGVYCVPGLEQQRKNLAEFQAGRYPTGIIPAGCTR